jgi:hypothetical protein
LCDDRGRLRFSAGVVGEPFGKDECVHSSEKRPQKDELREELRREVEERPLEEGVETFEEDSQAHLENS